MDIRSTSACAGVEAGIHAGLVHTIKRTTIPLNGIRGMIELLGRTDLSEEQAKLARILKDSGDDLTAILNELLEYSSATDANNRRRSHALFPVNDCAREVCDMLMRPASEKGLSLFFSSDDADASMVLGDRDKLVRILNVLIKKAIARTEQGRVTVFSTVEGDRSKPKQTRIFTIKDTSVGFVKSYLDVLNAALSGNKSSEQAVDLDYLTAAATARSLGGKVTATSEIYYGTTLTVSIPYATTELIG